MKEKFYNYISDCIKNEEFINCEWKKDNTEIIFNKKDAKGFDVIVTLAEDIIYIETDKGYDNHFHIKQFNNFDNALETVMGLVRNLLTRNMRIKEIYSNGKPKKWLLQKRYKNGWKTESVTGSLVWNFFGKRTEKICSNDILSPREI